MFSERNTVVSSQWMILLCYVKVFAMSDNVSSRHTNCVPCVDVFSRPIDHSVDALDFLSHQKTACQLESFVILSDSDLDLHDQTVLERLLVWQTPLTHITVSQQWIDSDMDADFNKIYREYKLYNLVIMSVRFLDIICRVNSLFSQHSPISLALHNMKIIIVTRYGLPDAQLDYLPIQIDNVAKLMMTESEQNLFSAQTLMWRGERTRQFDDAFSNDKNKCQLFPNAKYALNNRVLRVQAKEYGYQVQRTSGKQSSQSLYEGFEVDILNLIAKSLNFSYTFTPEPAVSNQMTWSDVSEFLAQDKADLGIPCWSIFSQHTFNHSVASSPLFSDFITVAYKEVVPHSPLESVLTRLFQKEVNLAFLGSFLITFILSGYVSGCMGRRKVVSENDPTSIQENNEQVTSKAENNESENRNDGTCAVKEDRPRSGSSIVSGFVLISDLIFGLIGSVLQQGSLPSTNSISLRVLLWTWSLLVLIITSVYKGSLTAEKIQTKSQSAFLTVEEALTDDKFDVCLPSEYASNLQTMADAKNGSVLKRISDKVVQFHEHNPTECKKADDIGDILKTRQNIMVLAYGDDIKRIFSRENITDVIFVKERFMTTFCGIPSPKNSELIDLLSAQVQKLTEQGIIRVLLEKWNGMEHGITNTDTTDTNDINRNLEDLSWIFYWCGLGVLAAFFALFIESAVAYCVKM